MDHKQKQKMKRHQDIHLWLSEKELLDAVLVKVWFLQERHLDKTLSDVIRYCIQMTAKNLKWMGSKPESLS